MVEIVNIIPKYGKALSYDSIQKNAASSEKTPPTAKPQLLGK